jgi:hypothetical protein
MGFGVWLVGYADQPHPKISSFRRLRRESRLDFHKASHFVKILGNRPGCLQSPGFYLENGTEKGVQRRAAPLHPFFRYFSPFPWGFRGGQAAIVTPLTGERDRKKWCFEQRMLLKTSFFPAFSPSPLREKGPGDEGVRP